MDNKSEYEAAREDYDRAWLAYVLELARSGYNAKKTCAELNISPETFRRWWASDTQFRTAVYQSLVAVYLESPYK
jgi:transposase-like protein